MQTKIVRLRMGDWSDDGHGKTKSFFIQTNFSSEAIEEAYKAGLSTFKHQKELSGMCEEFEDRSVNYDLYLEAIEKGADPEWFEKYEITDEDDRKSRWYTSEPGPPFRINIWRDEFAKFYMFVAHLGNQDLTWQEVKMDTIEIGGYGLFH